MKGDQITLWLRDVDWNLIRYQTIRESHENISPSNLGINWCTQLSDCQCITVSYLRERTESKTGDNSNAEKKFTLTTLGR